MQQAQRESVPSTITTLPQATPVPRKHTTAGGFAVDLKSMPALQSGQSGAHVVADKADDPKEEASVTALALISRLAEIAQDIRDDRFIQAADSVQKAKRMLADVASYVDHLALKLAVPHKCPRCKVTETHDAEGKSFCAGCVSATFGRVRL